MCVRVCMCARALLTDTDRLPSRFRAARAACAAPGIAAFAQDRGATRTRRDVRVGEDFRVEIRVESTRPFAASEGVAARSIWPGNLHFRLENLRFRLGNFRFRRGNLGWGICWFGQWPEQAARHVRSSIIYINFCFCHTWSPRKSLISAAASRSRCSCLRALRVRACACACMSVSASTCSGETDGARERGTAGASEGARERARGVGRAEERDS